MRQPGTPHRAGARRVPVVVCAALLVGGCTSKGPSQPKVADFTAGACRSAAPAVLRIGQAVDEVSKRHRKPATVEPALLSAQTALRAMPPAPDPSVRGKLRALTVAVGFFRIGVDSNTFQPQRTTDVAAAQRAVVAACTGKSKS